MAYYPHAFQKVLVALPKTQVEDFVTAAVATTAIVAGQVGVVNKFTNTTIDISDLGTAVYATNPVAYLAQGSFHTVDRLGNSFHGGYQETVKSAGINPKYVSEFYVTEPGEALNEVWSVCANGCEMPCETTYRLRVDVKGSPVLRALQHNLYQTVDAWTGCCADPDQPNFVDPNTVLLQWADKINENNLLSPFIRAFVIDLEDTAECEYEDVSTIITDDATFIPVEGMYITGTGIPVGSYVGTVTEVGAAPVTNYEFTVVDANGELVVISETFDALVTFYNVIDTDTYVPAEGADIADVVGCLIVEAAYVDTKFGICSFDPRDHYEIEPLEMNLSVVDDSGDPCVVQCLTETELQQGVQGKGYADTLVREYILFKRYLQEDFHLDYRMREVLDDTVATCATSDIPMDTKYVVYHILHSVPRKANSDGMLDNDQYLIKIVCEERDSDFEAWMNAWIASAGNHVQLVEMV